MQLSKKKEENSVKILDKSESDLEFTVMKIEIHNSKISGNRGSYLECCDQAENSEDLIL